jgi:hypothetical protein
MVVYVRIVFEAAGLDHRQSARAQCGLAGQASAWILTSTHCAPPASLEASAALASAARVCLHRCTDVRDTQNRLAISRSLTPISNHLRGGQLDLLPAGRSAVSSPSHRGTLCLRTAHHTG